MANLNRICLMGRVTRDPDLRYTPTGVAVIKFGLAVNYVYTSKDGKKNEEVTFFDATAFEKRAETLSKFVHKGDPIYLEGRMVSREWTTDSGEKRKAWEVKIETFQFLDGKKESGGSSEPTTEPDPWADNPLG